MTPRLRHRLPWTPRPTGGEPEHADVGARKLDWVRRAGVHAMGHATYEEMAKVWPTSDDYAQPMNEIPKLVPKTLTRADLVDEYRPVTRPAALGSAQPMFKHLTVGRRLGLAEVTPYPDGTITSICRRSQ